MASEERIILLLARGKLSRREQEQALALLATPLRWDVIIESAKAQEIYPLLYRNLDTLGFRGIPAQVRGQLRNLSITNAFRNILLAKELARLLTLLSSAGIAAIPLKGVALAESLYGDLTLRPCSDIDLLVPRQMVARAADLLIARGYRSEFTSRFFADVLRRHNIEYVLMREERKLRYVLDLHWGVLCGGPSDKNLTENLWAEARPTAILGAPAYALSAEWEVLYLAAHAARHQWQGLKWLVDLHELCSSREIKWDKVRSKAQRLGWEEMLRLTLRACHALLNTPMPGDISLSKLPPWLKLFPASASPTWRDAFFPIRLLKRPSEKLRYLARVFLVPTLAERQAVRLPSLLNFLYYPLRLMRLGCKWSWLLLRGAGAKISL